MVNVSINLFVDLAVESNSLMLLLTDTVVVAMLSEFTITTNLFFWAGSVIFISSEQDEIKKLIRRRESAIGIEDNDLYVVMGL